MALLSLALVLTLLSRVEAVPEPVEEPLTLKEPIQTPAAPSQDQTEPKDFPPPFLPAGKASDQGQGAEEENLVVFIVSPEGKNSRKSRVQHVVPINQDLLRAIAEKKGIEIKTIKVNLPKRESLDCLNILVIRQFNSPFKEQYWTSTKASTDVIDGNSAHDADKPVHDHYVKRIYKLSFYECRDRKEVLSKLDKFVVVDKALKKKQICIADDIPDNWYQLEHQLRQKPWVNLNTRYDVAKGYPRRPNGESRDLPAVLVPTYSR